MKKLYRTVFAVFLLMSAPASMLQAEETENLPAEALQPAIVVKEGVIATPVENR